VDEAFIIMQIGDSELDTVCDLALQPAISDAGYRPRRVDRHNAGDLLKSEIVEFIERSQIIVADVTNERPNCYLEIGYAMGVGKKSNLILTARRDHHHSSQDFDVEGPRIHFDLEGYDILLWNPDDLEEFRTELAKRIKRRAAILQSSRPAAGGGAEELRPAPFGWRGSLREKAETGLKEVGLHAYMEITAEIHPPLDVRQPQLVDAMRAAGLHTTGWPMAILLDNRDEYRPRPTSDGIVAEVPIGDPEGSRATYDFWKLFRDGRFYTLLSLVEDRAGAGETIYFDSRIHRITEAMLLLTRLYRHLQGSDGDQVQIGVRHLGLLDRVLGVANNNRAIFEQRRGSEDISEVLVETSLADLESDLVGMVRKVTDPLFMLFDFMELDEKILKEIVEAFAAGEVR
jgi:hypothetical protein